MTDTFNRAEGRRVVAADTADDLGEVKGFIVDSTATTIEALHIAGRGKRAEAVPWSAVRSFGTDAVMVEVADAAERVSTEREVDAVKGQIVARESRILTTHGFEVGSVDDVEFDTETGALRAITTDDGSSIPADRLRSLGSYALIINPS